MELRRLREIPVLRVTAFRLFAFILQCVISIFHQKTLPRFSHRPIRVEFVAGKLVS